MHPSFISPLIRIPFRGMGVLSMLLPFLLLLPAMAAETDSLPASRTFVIHETYQQDESPADDKATQPAKPPLAIHGFVGLDLSITPNRYPLIQGIFPGSPSDRKGIWPGDRIVAINSVSALGKSTAEVDGLISDRPGDRVTFTLLRESRLLQVELTVAAATTGQTAWSASAMPDKGRSGKAPVSGLN